MAATGMAAVQMMAMQQQQNQTIETQIMTNAQKQQAERQKIMYDTQTKKFEIIQDATINRMKTSDKMFNMADSYIRQ